ncbi:MAG: hypothetical protein V7644_197 [Actinomycetota bacterium]|jgi:hypothetical protein
MNSAINYYSAAQGHADAIRESRRNPVVDTSPRQPRVERQAPRPHWLLVAARCRTALQPLLIRL